MKKFALCFALLLSTCLSQAQKSIIENRTSLRKYLLQNVYAIDSSASAIVLYEKGFSDLSAGNHAYKIERIIKVLKKDAVEELANVIVPCGKNDYLTNISGTTYNLREDKVEQQNVTYPDMERFKSGVDHAAVKLALPSVKEGSIIYYTYTINTSGKTFSPEWYFQGIYPCVHSEYELFIPRYMQYTTALRTHLPIKTVTTRDEMIQCEACSWGIEYNQPIPSTHGAPSNCAWARNNIPALPREPFTESLDNYRERIKLYITAAIVSETVPYGFQNATVVSESPQHIFETWEELTRKVFYNDNLGCGQVFNNNHFLKAITDSLVKDKKSALEKAKSIYHYVKKAIAIKENGDNTANIKNVFEKKTGDKISINLLLAAMLRKAGLDAEPLLLSTRDKERMSSHYADPTSVNFIAVQLIADQKNYFLDAGEKTLPWGILAPNCYNGYARTVNKRGRGIMLTPDSLFNKTAYMISIVPDDQHKQKLRVTVDVQYGQISSFYLRQKWEIDTSEIRKTIIQDLNGYQRYNVELESYIVKNRTNVDTPLAVHYVASLTFQDTTTTIELDPLFLPLMKKNPFNENTRIYPIELNYREDINYTLRFHIPRAYTLEAYPRSTTLKLDNQERMLLKSRAQFDETDKVLAISTKFSINATSYPPNEYAGVRLFYDGVVKEQNQKLILRKSD